MTDETQTYFNLAIMVFGGLGGWILNSLRDSIRSLHDNDAALSAKLQGIEVLVAGKYATNESIEKITTALFAKLDKIDAKLDGKADRSLCAEIHRRD